MRLRANAIDGNNRKLCRYAPPLLFARRGSPGRCASAENGPGHRLGAMDEFLGTCARRAAELRMGGLDSAPMASRLLCYFRQRVSVSLQRSQARAVHHRAARAIERSVGLRAEVVQDGRVRTADLHTLSRVGGS